MKQLSHGHAIERERVPSSLWKLSLKDNPQHNPAKSGWNFLLDELRGRQERGRDSGKERSHRVYRLSLSALLATACAQIPIRRVPLSKGAPPVIAVVPVNTDSCVLFRHLHPLPKLNSGYQVKLPTNSPIRGDRETSTLHTAFLITTTTPGSSQFFIYHTPICLEMLTSGDGDQTIGVAVSGKPPLPPEP
ncbi:unnamed protein product [Pleuronectes platessa]|uniref:Uncharacterized protein n=1 Tax=Pleuronectes platessa TaxID=8262 RepID=A0A9N7YK93_PLEPL|nr:unnamed protein product [Pleuronectes platessa]